MKAKTILTKEQQATVSKRSWDVDNAIIVDDVDKAIQEIVDNCNGYIAQPGEAFYCGELLHIIDRVGGRVEIYEHAPVKPAAKVAKTTAADRARWNRDVERGGEF